MTRRTLALLVVFAALGTSSACRGKPAVQPQPAGMSDADRAKFVADSIAAADALRRQNDAMNASRNNAPATPASPAEASRMRTEVLQTLTQKVYFDYDQDALRDDARSTLDAKAAALSANGSVSLVITGHTDERGTAEYNLALGQRRAAQVKRYLVSKGVQESRLTTQSLGDSQPAVQGTDESAYQQNRRAEFEPQNAGGTLMRPRS